MSYAQTLFSFTDTNTIYFGKARQKTKYIAWEHLKRPGVSELNQIHSDSNCYYVLYFAHKNILPVNTLFWANSIYLIQSLVYCVRK